jgi:CheY-like chemotaxis protein
VFSQDAKIVHRLSPLLRRVMVVDPVEASAKATGELLFAVGRPDVWTAAGDAKALKLAAKVDPALIVCELDGEKTDGVAFARALRRSDLACRRAPVILVGRQAPAASVLGARDAGVDEFLPRPFTAKDLLRRLEAVLLQPRDWVEAMDYVGPDRRRFNSGDFTGAPKRREDLPGTPQGVRIAQALKILRAALSALETDPGQARRAMLAQAETLHGAAADLADSGMASASADLHRYLRDAAAGLDRRETERWAGALLAYMPRDGEGRAAA